MSLRSVPPPRRARRSPVVPVLVAFAAALLIVIVAAVALNAAGRGEPDGRGDGLVAADVDRDTPVRQPAALPADLDLDAWAARTSDPTGIPARALSGYAMAEIAQRRDTPDCGLSWATLAGIGRVESDHGRLGAADLDADGVARPSIIGIPLDGTNGTREILDTDGGALDGDVTYDRAVGPMQFLPQTWVRYSRGGDPHLIDHAARAASRYLCAGDRDLASGPGWWAGILTYNQSTDYARLVWAAVDRYVTAAP